MLRRKKIKGKKEKEKFRACIQKEAVVSGGDLRNEASVQ